MFDVDHMKFSVSSWRCYFHKLFVVKNFLAWVIINEQTVRKLFRYIQSGILDELNVRYFLLYSCKCVLEPFVEVKNFENCWVEGPTLQHVEYEVSFPRTTWAYNRHEDPIVCETDFINNLGFGKNITNQTRKQCNPNWFFFATLRYQE